MTYGRRGEQILTGPEAASLYTRRLREAEIARAKHERETARAKEMRQQILAQIAIGLAKDTTASPYLYERMAQHGEAVADPTQLLTVHEHGFLLSAEGMIDQMTKGLGED